MRDGNVGTSNPVFYNADLDYWCYALFIANHMYSTIEPWSPNRELGTGYFNFYDITGSNPFYVYSGGSYVQTTSNNVTSATHYRTGSTYNRITATPVKIGNVIFFSY